MYMATQKAHSLVVGDSDSRSLEIQKAAWKLTPNGSKEFYIWV